MNKEYWLADNGHIRTVVCGDFELAKVCRNWVSLKVIYLGWHDNCEKAKKKAAEITQ